MQQISEQYQPRGSDGPQVQYLIPMTDFVGFHKLATGVLSDLDGPRVAEALVIMTEESRNDWYSLDDKNPETTRRFVDNHVEFQKYAEPDRTSKTVASFDDFIDYELMAKEFPLCSRAIGQYLKLRNGTEPTGGRFTPENEKSGDKLQDKSEQKAIQYNWDMLASCYAMSLTPEGRKHAVDTLDNFADLIERLGFVPNSSTEYGSGRSQPPVMIDMVYQLAKSTGEWSIFYDKYLDSLETYFNFWGEGADDPNKLGQEVGNSYRRVVRVSEDCVMYRNYDDHDGPREEMYAHDLKVGEEFKEYIRMTKGREATKEEVNKLYKDIRAGAESAEDFCAAQFKDGEHLYTIHTTDLVSAKLNAQMYKYGKKLAEAYRMKSQYTEDPSEVQEYKLKAESYDKQADSLAAGIRKYCLSEEDGLVCDYDFVEGDLKPAMSLSAAVWGLTCGIFNPEESSAMLDKIHQKFFCDGAGLVNSLYEKSQEQWDNNIWPIMQMIAIDAAIQNERFDLAFKWAKATLESNQEIHRINGELYEKNKAKKAGLLHNKIKVGKGEGGEYDCVINLRMTIAVCKVLLTIIEPLKHLASQQQEVKRKSLLEIGCRTIGSILIAQAASQPKVNDVVGS